MALALFDRVQETTTTIGTGSLALAGAVSGFQSFAVVGNGNTCYYTIVDGSAWEVGIGTYSTGSTGATQAAGPTSGSWVTDGSLVGSNITWYSASDTGYAAGDYVLLFDQTAGSSFFYSGQITLIQFAGGFGFAFSANMLSSGGTPNGSPSSSWIMQETAVATTLARTTILSNSNADTSPITLTSGSKPVFLTYPAEKSVNLDASGNVSPLGTVSSGTWQGATVGVAYGGTGVTASSGANSVMLRDTNQNVSVNRLNQADTQTTAAGGITVLTAASTYSQSLKNTGSQTYKMPDATTLATGVAFIFNNNATGVLTLQDYAAGAIGTITSGGAAELVLLDNTTVAGTWDVHGFLPEAVTWGTNALALGTTVITGGTWNGGTIAPAYGGTGLTTFAGANNALYSTGASTLTAGTLPVVAGGTGLTSFTANGVVYASGTNTLTSGSALTFDGTNLYVGGTTGAFGGTQKGFAAESGAVIAVLNGESANSVGSVGTVSNHDFSFKTNGTEQMRLTSTGLGIGTSSPSQKLSVTGNGGFTGWVGATGGGSGLRVDGVLMADRDQDNNVTLIGGSDNTLRLRTGSTTRATLDSSGNLGLGVTPSAWNTGKALEINAVGTGLWGAFGNTYLNANNYYNAADKFAGTGYAVRYLQVPSNGQHQWLVSTASGSTAGDPITFTQAMTLDASGNLGIGTTSPNATGSVGTVIHINGTTKSEVHLTNGTAGTSASDGANISLSDLDLYINNRENGFTAFFNNGSERARIDSSGNLLVGTTISPTGTGKISTPTGYTAPDNAAGAGTTLNILGSTGTGQASATGGNGVVQIIGGGGTSPWTNFGGGFGRRRGGILLQAGLAAADAGATYFNGSTINIFGSTATNNGTTTGLGSQIQITAGSAVSPTGTNGGGSVNLNASGGTTSGSVGISAGFAAATSANGGSASLNGGGSNTGTGGTLSLNGGSSSGGAGGPVNIQAGNSTGVAGANVSIGSGTGTANGKIGFTVGALGEVVQIGPTGAIGLSGANYGTAGQVLTSNGSSAVPTWATPGGSPATSTTLGTVYGYTDSANSNLSLGYNAGTNAQGSNSIAIGKASGTNNQGSNSIAIGTNAADNDQGSNSVAVGENAGRFSQIGRSVAIGAYAGLGSQGFGSIAIGYSSGSSSQNEGAIAIGNSSGAFSTTTGQGQGLNSIAIGNNAGNTLSLPYHQAANSIVLNATGLDYSAQNTGLYVKPIRTSVAAVGTQFSLVWDDSTGEISASAGPAPAGASWYSYVVGTGTDVTVPLPAGWDPAVFQGSGYLWTITSVNGSGYNPTPPYAWNNVGSPTWFWRVFQSNSGHPAPYPEFTDPTTFNFSSSPGIYTMLYISQIADSKTSLYTVYTPSSPNVYFGTYQYTAPGFPVFGSNQTGHSVIQMIGDFSNGSTYAVPSPTGTLDEVLYEPSSGMTIFFISHTSAQVSQISMGTPILVMNTTSSSGSLAFWYSYS